MKAPDYPTLFARFPSSLIAHSEPIMRPRASEKLDYEGELVAVIGKGGRHIPRAARSRMSAAIRSSTTDRSATFSSARRNGRSARISTIQGRSARFSSAPTNCRPARMV
jgi:hypothetical protein